MGESRQVSQQVVESTRVDLIHDEDIVLHVYQDSRQIWTLGIGTNVDGAHGGGITTLEAFYLCDNRIEKAILQLIGRFPWFITLDPVRQSAFINLCFNLGIDGISTFKKAIAAASIGDWITCRTEFLNSLWSHQIQPSRRDRILKMIGSGAR